MNRRGRGHASGSRSRNSRQVSYPSQYKTRTADSTGSNSQPIYGGEAEWGGTDLEESEDAENSEKIDNAPQETSQGVTPVLPYSTALIEDFIRQYPFSLDQFQLDAIEILAQGKSVLVTAPTGTGKTIIAEFAIYVAQQARRQVIYTTPLKALSNQKFHDLRARYGDDVGLLTGDIVENRQGSILVMTTEIYRNMLLQDAKSVRDVSHVIFDESHFLGDEDRGPVWEEAMICSPGRIQLICLSATISNASEIAKWISSVHHHTHLIVHTQRAVPLEHFYFLDGKLFLVRDAEGHRHARFPGIGGEAKRARRYSRDSWKDERVNLESSETVVVGDTWHEPPTPPDVLEHLATQNLLPCIYFYPSRKATETAALECANLHLITDEESQHIMEVLHAGIAGLSREEQRLAHVQSLTHLLSRGIAFHHAGMLPTLKGIVELLFSSGLLKVVFATDTLALGVNMPARSVVISSLSKFDGESRRLLFPNEYQQLTGRAGRRGMDQRGAAVVLYSEWEAFEPSFQAVTGNLNPIRSRYAIRYNSVLNLWHPGAEEELLRIFASTLREFQDGHEREQRRQLAVSLSQTLSQKNAERAARGQRVRRKDVRKQEQLERHIEASQRQRSRRELRGVRKVLETLDFIDPRSQELTPKGGVLRDIFHPAGILLVEAATRGYLGPLKGAELADVASWLVYDRSAEVRNRYKLSPELNRARTQMQSLVATVQALEIQFGLSPSTGMIIDFHGVASAWSQGKELPQILQMINLAEGDILMILNQTIDVLQQLRNSLQREPALAPGLLPVIEQATGSLLRGIVLQSRIMPIFTVSPETPPDKVLEVAASIPGKDFPPESSLEVLPKYPATRGAQADGILLEDE